MLKHPHLGPYTLLQYTIYLSFLHELSEHNNDMHLFLPYHPPEVIDGVSQRTLSGNVAAFVGIALIHN